MYKFALIGCGTIGARHAALIALHATLVAVCDTDEKKAALFAEQYNSRWHAHIDALLEAEKDLEVLCICTPNGLHAEHAIKALQQGLHVVCEKPLCISTTAAYSMMDTAYFFRRQLFIVKQNRYNPPVQFVKGLLQQNAFGKILSFGINCFWHRPQQYYNNTWRGTGELDGGLLYTQFSHFIDLLFWFLGDIKRVNGLKQNSGMRQRFEIEDSGALSVEMHNGAIGTINYSINTLPKNIEGSFTLIGEKGSVKIGGQYLNTIEWLHTAKGHKYTAAATAPANNYGFYEGSMSNHHLFYQDVIKALNGAAHTIPTVKEAVKTVSIIEDMYKAMNR